MKFAEELKVVILLYVDCPHLAQCIWNLAGFPLEHGIDTFFCSFYFHFIFSYPSQVRMNLQMSLNWVRKKQFPTRF